MHHPIWNYDLPNVPILVNVTVDGQDVPMAIQTTKQGMTFAFNRETGEPVWPIDERPVPASIVPGEQLSDTQPFPTRPAPLNPLGLTEDDLIDLTPELKAEALGDREPVPDRRSLYTAAAGEPHRERQGLDCLRGGRAQHYPPGHARPGEPAICISRTDRLVRAGMVQPGADVDGATHGCTADSGECTTTGRTISDWVQGGGVGFTGPQGLPMYKPPFSKITAIDMNTGEHVFAVPVGEPDDRVKDHPALQGVDLSGVGATRARPILMTTGSLLLATEGTNGSPVLNAHDKRTGETLGTVELPAPGQYGMMTYLHDGQQYIIVQIGQGGTFPGSLAALRLPMNSASGDSRQSRGGRRTTRERGSIPTDRPAFFFSAFVPGSTGALASLVPWPPGAPASRPTMHGASALLVRRSPGRPSPGTARVSSADHSSRRV